MSLGRRRIFRDEDRWAYLRLAGGDRLTSSLMPPMREVFIEASTAMVEAFAGDPAGFYKKRREAPEVDSATLEKFREAFIR